jgi:hypothetical protein
MNAFTYYLQDWNQIIYILLLFNHKVIVVDDNCSDFEVPVDLCMCIFFNIAIFS